VRRSAPHVAPCVTPLYRPLNPRGGTTGCDTPTPASSQVTAPNEPEGTKPRPCGLFLRQEGDRHEGHRRLAARGSHRRHHAAVRLQHLLKLEGCPQSAT